MLINQKTRQLIEAGEIFFLTEMLRFLASEIIYYNKIYGTIQIADFYTYLQDKPELLDTLKEVLALELSDEIEDNVILDYVKVMRENSVNQERKRLQKMMKEIVDPLEQAKIAEKIRKLKMGS